MLRECEGDGNVGVGDGICVVDGIGVVSEGHVGGTRGSGIVSSAADVQWMSVVRGVGEYVYVVGSWRRGSRGG